MHATETTVKSEPSERAARPTTTINVAALRQAPVWSQRQFPLQASLKINAPHDKYEQEADRTAEQVMQMPQPRVQRKTCACGRPLGADGMCAECKRKKLGIQRLASQEAPQVAAPPIVHQVLQQAGHPLDSTTRNFMEARFGQDFGHVRVHTGRNAAESARAVNALAYTVGNHIVFGSQQWQTGTPAGKQLLAHELVHTVQQGAVGFLNAPPQIAQGSRSERSTNRLTDQVAGGNPTVGLVRGGAELVVQRACNAEIGSVEGCIARGGDIADFGESSDSIYLFNRGCDDFAPGERERLEDYANTIAFDARVDIDGFASEEGEPTFNENLSCARSQRAQEIISAIAGVQTAVYKHGRTPGDRQTHRSAVITVRTAESEPQPVDSAAPTPASPATPAAPTLVVPPEDCAAAPRETALNCTPNPHGSHLPPVGGTHDEAHAFEPCLLTEAQVAASADWCVDRQQAHGGEVCYRQIPSVEGDPGDQYCYSLNCCHNSRDQVSVVDPASAGSGACCDNAGWLTTGQHVWEDVGPEFIEDPARVIEDVTGIPVEDAIEGVEDFVRDLVGP